MKMWSMLAVVLVFVIGCGGDSDGGGSNSSQRSLLVWVLSRITGAVESNDVSFEPAISADGRYVVFTSLATNWVATDSNQVADVFLVDRQSGVVERVSQSSLGVQGDKASTEAVVSSGATVVAFASEATNLDGLDGNDQNDIFILRRAQNQLRRINLSPMGQEANNASAHPAISANGRFVAYQSFASNLVAGDTNGTADIFVYDIDLNVTERVNVSSAGAATDLNSDEPSLSTDGRYVAFQSFATNLVAGDTNNTRDIFVRDRTANHTSRVSIATDGVQANGPSLTASISGDGRYVTFASEATNLVAGDTNGFEDIFLHDRVTGQTIRISVGPQGQQANGRSYWPSVNQDGRFVVFDSTATNLVEGGTSGHQVFIYDRVENFVRLLSQRAAGTPGNAISERGALSGDGKAAVFHSDASNFITDDGNALTDIFLGAL